MRWTLRVVDISHLAQAPARQDNACSSNRGAERQNEALEACCQVYENGKYKHSKSPRAIQLWSHIRPRVKFPQQSILPCQDAQTHIVPHAIDVAQLGRSAFDAGEAIAARDAQPLYLRNKVALTTAERLAKAAA